MRSNKAMHLTALRAAGDRQAVMRHEMSSDDWYRNTEWNEEIAERFEARLKRARRKAQYLRIQACTLAESEPRVALQLLDRYFELDEKFDHAQAYVNQATAYRHLGQLEDAIKSYEKALRREAEFPNLRAQASLDLPFLIATAPVPDRFEQALSVLDESADQLRFPVDVFRWNAAYALILLARSRHREASSYARAALEAAAQDKSGFHYHQHLGLVSDRYSDLVRDLRAIAHAA